LPVLHSILLLILNVWKRKWIFSSSSRVRECDCFYTEIKNRELGHMPAIIWYYSIKRYLGIVKSADFHA
jgi:hypothetical protein